MNLLAFDTSTNIAFVALHSKGVFYELSQDTPREHALRLLPMIKQLLTNAKIQIADLEGIVFGRGPGSFTGLRIASSIAQGLAFAHNLPVYPVSTLAAIIENTAGQIPEPTETILAVMDARMQEVYWAYGKQDSQISLEQVNAVNTITVPLPQSITLAGVGFETYLDNFSPQVLAQITKKITVFPTATAMLRLVLKGQITAVKASEALPIYIRNNVTQ